MKMNGGQILCESLLMEGVDVVFGLPGGAILPLYGTLPEYPQLRHILMRHEQGAAMAADGYARATGKVGVCFATSGPGASNLITGLAAANMDSVPIVAITGQVARDGIGKDAFQEMDTTGVTLPITKHNYLVMNASDIAATVKQAFHIARTGRPAPVLVDIPKDVFQEMAEFEYPSSIHLPGYNPTLEGDDYNIEKAADLINKSSRPVILAGHGVLLSQAHEELKELAEKTQTPVVTTLLGLSAFPETHILSLGMPGMHGVAWASLALDQTDLIISLGSRFDDRVTGDLNKFAPKARIVHVDIDPSEIDKSVKADVPIIGDIKAVLKKLNVSVETNTHSEWISHLDGLRKNHPSLRIRDTQQLLPQYIINQISEITGGEAIIVTGVGQHQMWAAQHYTFQHPFTMITSGGAGAMGYEVPGALGAQVGMPDKIVWSVAGDGGFQMTMSELATIVENNIPVKFALLNNRFLGMVRQWQQFFYNKEYTHTEYKRNPDFVKLTEAFGLMGIRVTNRDQVSDAIKQAMECPGPALIDFMIEEEENVYPMIPAGKAVEDLIEEPMEVTERA